MRFSGSVLLVSLWSFQVVRRRKAGFRARRQTDSGAQLRRMSQRRFGAGIAGCAVACFADEGRCVRGSDRRGSAERSLLYRRVSSGQMPPTGPLAKEAVTYSEDGLNREPGGGGGCTC